jgi:hypothetical protein
MANKQWATAWACAVLASTAGPAIAQSNVIGFDYMEASTSHTLAPNATLAQYQLDTGAGVADPLSNMGAVAVGLSDHLTVAGALQAGGENAQDFGTPRYQVGMLYAFPTASSGWSPAVQLQYQGGFDQLLSARGVLSYDAAVPAIVGGGDRLNLTANLIADQAFVGGGETTYRYALATSYPLWAAPAGDAQPGSPLERLQWRASSRLRAAVELTGDVAQSGSHYAIPELFVSPVDSLQVGLGVGLRLAGEDKPFYVQSQVQFNF